MEDDDDDDDKDDDKDVEDVEDVEDLTSIKGSRVDDKGADGRGRGGGGGGQRSVLGKAALIEKAEHVGKVVRSGNFEPRERRASDGAQARVDKKRRRSIKRNVCARSPTGAAALFDKGCFSRPAPATRDGNVPAALQELGLAKYLLPSDPSPPIRRPSHPGLGINGPGSGRRRCRAPRPHPDPLVLRQQATTSSRMSGSRRAATPRARKKLPARGTKGSGILRRVAVRRSIP
jgi:hypothetical protein